MILDLYSRSKFGIDVVSRILDRNNKILLFVHNSDVLTAITSQGKKETFHFLVTLGIDLLDHIFSSELSFIKSHIHPSSPC